MIILLMNLFMFHPYSIESHKLLLVYCNKSCSIEATQFGVLPQFDNIFAIINATRKSRNSVTKAYLKAFRDIYSFIISFYRFFD